MTEESQDLQKIKRLEDENFALMRQVANLERRNGILQISGIFLLVVNVFLLVALSSVE